MSRDPALRRVLEAVHRHMQVTPDLIMSSHRGKPWHARARWAATRAYHALTAPTTFTATGRVFQRDRSSVSYGLRRLVAERQEDRVLETALQAIDQELGL